MTADKNPRLRLPAPALGVLLALAALLSACGDRGQSPDTSSKKNARPRQGASNQKKKQPARTAPADLPPGRVVLINPTLAVQEKAGVRLDPLEVRPATDAEIRALGAKKPAAKKELTLCVGGVADFLQTEHVYGAGTRGVGPKVIKRWRGVASVTVDAGPEEWGLLHDVPFMINSPYAAEVVLAHKLTWTPPPLPKKDKAWTDALRHSLLSWKRHDFKGSSQARARAYSQLDQVRDSRFGPLLLAWLVGTKRGVDGSNWRGRTLRVLQRFAKDLDAETLTRARRDLAALEKKRPQPKARGCLAAVLAMAGKPGEAAKMIPRESSARRRALSALNGAPRDVVHGVAKPLWAELDSPSRLAVVDSWLADDAPMPAKDVTVVDGLARGDVQLEQRVARRFSERIRLGAKTMDLAAAAAMLEFALPQLKNDRFPVQYLWQAGPRTWPVVLGVWDRLSVPTRKAAATAVAGFDAPLEERKPFLLRAMASEPKVAEPVLRWVAKNPAELDDELREAARSKAADPGTPARSRRMVERALGKNQ